MNEFIERYKTYSNSDLLKVIEKQSDYQAKAVEAAKSEIQERNLSDQEFQEAKNVLKNEREERKKLNDKKALIEQKVKAIGSTFFDTINPIQKSAPSAEKLIRLITIVFGLIPIVRWYNEFGLITSILTDDKGGWDLSIVEYFLPLILLPAAIILFWLRKKSGWILMASYLTYSTISTIGLTIMTWNMQPSRIASIDNLFPQTSPITLMMTALFFGGTLWILTKKEIKELYEINKQTLITTFSISGILTMLFITLFIL
ncbi:MAG: hypothetical protein H6600_09415 [Flavobacteriales bacterium]|nr:hypothetical protein [Flavobacteriales bacterium]MCB9198667.1 hypothetical protein [Flavobacteriales bacterium]